MVTLRLSTPVCCGTTVSSRYSVAPCPSGASKLRSEASCNPAPAANAPWMWLICASGAGISATTIFTGVPTTGRAPSRNFTPIRLAAPAGPTAVTISASGFWSCVAAASDCGAGSCVARGLEGDWPHATSSTAKAAAAPSVPICARPIRIDADISTGSGIQTGSLNDRQQRGSLQHRALFAQIPHIALPEARLTGPREGPRERRVGPPLGNPSRVMQHAGCAQSLDQTQLAEFQGRELAVAFRNVHPLTQLLLSAARQEHPQVLHAWAVHAIIQIDEQRTGGAPQNVAEMAVAVQANQREGAGLGERRLDAGEQIRAA